MYAGTEFWGFPLSNPKLCECKCCLNFPMPSLHSYNGYVMKEGSDLAKFILTD